MSEIAEPRPLPPSAPEAVPSVHEAYSFACMKCGYGWEQGYEIEHHTDGRGLPFIVYKADGERVPSPLSNPTCMNCGGHVVRIMREGQVKSVIGMLDQLYHHRAAPGIAGPVPAGYTAKAPKPRKAPPHEGPGPVPMERPGPMARLLGFFRRS
ncbi:hypothetical protein OHA37_23105 [Streptomyces sp. NBC_00335]|uniref:hypothetical protein n=1 Tax=unclassified Streptomyces TaxID=2593676 RepID=UPI00224E128A|nr:MULTISPECIES: hypothetical protein [unclassified Streptomyces]MCX5406750.1 hypothetical protein [Streptomyces sp. NBC_00086]